MTEFPRIEGLDRDLLRVADRVAQAGYDPRHTIRRLKWSERAPIFALVTTVGILAFALAAGAWSAAAAVGILVLPDRIHDWRERKKQHASLLGEGDFLEQERERLENRVVWLRTGALIGLGGAIVLAYLAAHAAQGKPWLWAIAAFFAVRSLVRLFVIGPALARELRDLGGEDSGGWLLVVITFLLVLAAPLLVLGGFLYRGVRRLLGRPVEEEP